MSDRKPRRAIIPFGKYKGKPIETLRGDPDYVQYLLRDGWLRGRYPDMFQIVINNFGEPSSTPEHNGLQARFLDDAFCHGFFLLFPTFREPRTDLVERISYWQQRANQTHFIYESDREEAKRQLEKAKRLLSEFDAAPPSKPYPLVVERRDFEFYGWDVLLIGRLRMPQWEINTSVNAHIEIKTDLGDDYPAVLRQMKANLPRERYRDDDCYLLIIDNFTATGVTFKQVKEMFRAARFSVVTFADLEAAMGKIAVQGNGVGCRSIL